MAAVWIASHLTNICWELTNDFLFSESFHISETFVFLGKFSSWGMTDIRTRAFHIQYSSILQNLVSFKSVFDHLKKVCCLLTEPAKSIIPLLNCTVGKFILNAWSLIKMKTMGNKSHGTVLLLSSVSSATFIFRSRIRYCVFKARLVLLSSVLK